MDKTNTKTKIAEPQAPDKTRVEYDVAELDDRVLRDMRIQGTDCVTAAMRVEGQFRTRTQFLDLGEIEARTIRMINEGKTLLEMLRKAHKMPFAIALACVLFLAGCGDARRSDDGAPASVTSQPACVNGQCRAK